VARLHHGGDPGVARGAIHQKENPIEIVLTAEEAHINADLVLLRTKGSPLADGQVLHGDVIVVRRRESDGAQIGLEVGIEMQRGGCQGSAGMMRIGGEEETVANTRGGMRIEGGQENPIQNQIEIDHQIQGHSKDHRCVKVEVVQDLERSYHQQFIHCTKARLSGLRILAALST
jgi:hypothetical protein